MFLGAAVNLIVNIILIPYMAARGAVIGTIFAEIIVCIYQSYFVRKKIFIKKQVVSAASYLCDPTNGYDHIFAFYDQQCIVKI